MRKTWLVAKAEYLRLVKRRSFLLATLGIPLFFGVVMAVSILVAVGGRDDHPIGVVDHRPHPGQCGGQCGSSGS